MVCIVALTPPTAGPKFVSFGVITNESHKHLCKFCTKIGFHFFGIMYRKVTTGSNIVCMFNWQKFQTLFPEWLTASHSIQTEWNTVWKLTNWSLGSKLCLTQWNNEPYHGGATKTDLWVEDSDKTWSTTEGDGKPLHYSCFEIPWTIPIQKDMTAK